MLKTGDEYRESLRDGRAVWIDGERVKDVTVHPAFKPIVDVRARIYDMAHEAGYRDIMSYVDEGTNEPCNIGYKPPRTRDDWEDKRRAVDAVMNDIGGVVVRVGDETIGEVWSLWDGKDVLDEIDSQFSANVETHVWRALRSDTFHVSANTDPKGDRSKRPQEQDPDMLLHVVKETDRGIVVRGAKFETAAAYANQAFVKPTIANWGDEKLSDYAVGFIADMGWPGMKHICRTGFAGRRPVEDYPLANRFDEVDTLIVFDDVLVPWENVLFYRHTRAASFIRGTLHRYSAYPFVLRLLYIADMMIGTALFNVRQTGLDKQQAVREKLATLACYRETINAHLVASIALAEKSPAGLLMPNQSLLFTGRVHACSKLPEMVHLARELCGGQICVTPDHAAFTDPETRPLLEKYYTVNEDWVAEDRRKLLAFARDLLNSDYAGHRVTFELFAQSPPFAHLNAVYMNFGFDGPLEFVRKAADLSERVLGSGRGRDAAGTPNGPGKADGPGRSDGVGKAGRGPGRPRPRRRPRRRPPSRRRTSRPMPATARWCCAVCSGTGWRSCGPASRGTSPSPAPMSAATRPRGIPAASSGTTATGAASPSTGPSCGSRPPPRSRRASWARPRRGSSTSTSSSRSPAPANARPGIRICRTTASTAARDAASGSPSTPSPGTGRRSSWPGPIAGGACSRRSASSAPTSTRARRARRSSSPCRTSTGRAGTTGSSPGTSPPGTPSPSISGPCTGPRPTPRRPGGGPSRRAGSARTWCSRPGRGRRRRRFRSSPAGSPRATRCRGTSFPGSGRRTARGTRRAPGRDRDGFDREADAMTFSIAGRCGRTGMLGVAITTSSIAVGARCPWARAGVGAVATQNVTDPALGAATLDLLAAGLTPRRALARLVAERDHMDYRQLTVVDAQGRVAHFSGANVLGTHAVAEGPGCVAAGNLLANGDVPEAMVRSFAAHGEVHLAERLLRSLEEGLVAGGEVGPVRSAALYVVSEHSFPLVDLREDWCEDGPVARLRALWERYEPEMEAYVTRAVDPAAAPRYGVPGDP